MQRYLITKMTMTIPKRMNFRKSSKGRGGERVILIPKVYVAGFGPLNRAF